MEPPDHQQALKCTFAQIGLGCFGKGLITGFAILPRGPTYGEHGSEPQQPFFCLAQMCVRASGQMYKCPFWLVDI